MDILVVDDEQEIADLVEVCLLTENHQVYKCYTAEDALSIVENQHLDLAILDIMLPDMDGFEICRRIREHHTFPLIMLTARIGDMDKVAGLSIGADDYITKPFNPLELIARVKAQLRRYTQYNEGNGEKEREAIFEFRGLYINKDTHECILYGDPLSLTPLEFSILWLLCENKGKVLSSEEIFERVWQEKYLDSNNTVMVHIRRLREKMKEPSRNPRFIKTVWGIGYKIES